MRDPCNGNHARSRSLIPELSSDIIAQRRDVLAQGIQFADLERKIREYATDAFHVDSVVFRVDRRKCFVGYWSFHNLGDVTAFKKGPNQDRAFRHSF